MSKEHCCYKIHTFLTKSSAYFPVYRKPSYINNKLTPYFYKNVLIFLFMIFLKSQPSYK